MKKTIIFVALALFTLLSTVAVSANDSIGVFIDSAKLEFDVEPVIIDGRTMVPMRKIFEGLGASVSWDGDSKTVTSDKGDKKVSVQIDAYSIYVNGVEKILDVPAKLIESRTMVPVRAISEAFDCTVKWDGVKREVHIYSKERMVNVKDFGAVGDGVTDDKPALIKAFSYAINNLPATVYFPEGEYGILNGGIRISLAPGSGGLTVIGDGGDKSVIKFLEDWKSDGGWVAIRVQALKTPTSEKEYLHDITFSDIGVYDTNPITHAATLEADGAKEETHGFDIQHTIRATYRNCRIENVGDEALDLVYCKDSYIHDNIVINSPGAGSAGGAISVGDGCENVYVENNIVEGTVEGKDNFGIALEALVSGTDVKNVTIRNNQIKNINGNAINIGAPGGNIKDILICDNTITLCKNGIKFLGIGLKENIAVSHITMTNVITAVNATGSQNNKNVTIENFVIEGTIDTAFRIVGSENMTIKSGTVRKCKNGVLYNTSKNTVFDHILMSGVGLSGGDSKSAVIYQSDYTNSTVSNCTIVDCAFPIGISKMDKVSNTEIYINEGVAGAVSLKGVKEIYGGTVNRRIAPSENSSVVSGLAIKCDVSLGSTPAIYIINLTDCVIENCTIDIPEGSKAIVETGTSDNNIVRNNVTIGKRTIAKKGANSVFEGNIVK